MNKSSINDLFNSLDIDSRGHVGSEDIVQAVRHSGIASDDNCVLRRLLGFGINLSSADYDGRTPLYLAAAEGQGHTVNFLLDKQVDLELKDRWGYTPLDDARRHQHDLVCRTLEQAVDNARSDKPLDREEEILRGKVS